jgi:hypothetical protein
MLALSADDLLRGGDGGNFGKAYSYLLHVEHAICDANTDAALASFFGASRLLLRAEHALHLHSAAGSDWSRLSDEVVAEIQALMYRASLLWSYLLSVSSLGKRSWLQRRHATVQVRRYALLCATPRPHAALRYVYVFFAFQVLRRHVSAHDICVGKLKEALGGQYPCFKLSELEEALTKVVSDCRSAPAFQLLCEQVLQRHPSRLRASLMLLIHEGAHGPLRARAPCCVVGACVCCAPCAGHR